MSLEDDTENGEVELRELVTQTLEENGVLSKIRAQLRAGLYLALENDINTSCQDKYNDVLKTKLGNPDIRIIFCLVREFLEYFELNFTCNVFEKETLIGTAFNYENREKLIQELDIGIDTLHNSPLLLEILNVARSSFNISVRDIHNDIKFNSTTNAENKNTTYDIISHDKSNQSSDSITSEISQHVIGVKTLPKENVCDVTDSDNSKQKSNTIQNGNSEHNNYSSDKEKSENIQHTQQSEVVVNSKKIKNINEVEEKFETDDTYEGTSSIAEDSVVSNNKDQTALIDFDRSSKLSTNSPSTASKNIIDQTIEESPRSPRPSFSPDQNHSSEKKKYDKSERIEKLKPMSALSSLNDLPPLQLNKSRNSDTVLLPSLYSKDFRERSPMKEIDKLVDFDSLDNYEEDFLSSGSLDNEDVDFNAFKTSNIKLNKIKIDDQQKTTKNNAIKKEDNSTLNEINKNNENGNHLLEDNNVSTKPESVTTSISEEFDINSNVDDLLKSENT